MLTLTSAHAATIGDSPGPVQVIESPPTFGSCTTPISTISTQSLGSNGAVFTLSNTTSTRSQDALIFNLSVNGQTRLFWVPVALRPGVAVLVHAQFLTPVDSPILLLCSNHPVGIIEGDQPVVAVVAAPPEGSAGP